MLLKKYLPLAVATMLLLHFNKTWAKSDAPSLPKFSITLQVDTPPQTTPPDLPFPFPDQSETTMPLYVPDGGLMLSNPSNLKTDIQYNPQTGKYEIYQKIGNMDYRMPTEMDSDQFMDYMAQKSEHSYFQQKVKTTAKEEQKKGLIPPIKIGGKAFTDIFGSPYINIRPQGSAELTFGFNNSKLENPALPVLQRSLTTFNFDENIQLNVTGEIGDKLKLSTTYNTKATFSFQNQMKLNFNGHEDDIIKEIDAGNIAFNLPGTLITGSQSLFGVKLKTQFGRLTSTTVYAQEQGNKKTITVQNGAQTTNFNVKCDQYMANQHFFLSHFFRDQYDAALATPPIVNSAVTITKIEVWVTNTSSATQNTRDIVALSDLGESEINFSSKNPYVKMFNIKGISQTGDNAPFNAINTLNPPYLESHYPSINTPVSAVSGLVSAHLTQVTDFEKIDLARMLSPSEYTLNPKLGYISLKQPLNYDQVLAVAYQYTYNGQVYQVGQFSTDGVPTANELVVKMLKSTNVPPATPMWNLMMKNIYALGSYQINSQNFMLQVWYSNPSTGVDIPYLPTGSLEGKLLLQVMGLDRLDAEGDKQPDGVFDFLPGITIDAANGLVIFPSVEPFGSYMTKTLATNGYSSTAAQGFVFQSLYDSVLTSAQQQPNLDRYWIRGSFQSSVSSDISLGALNIPPGSVLVTAGGIKLTENVDYTVDYTLGRVKILNQGLLSSGTPIQVSLENNALFSIQSKTYFGQHFDYMVSKDFNLGATVVNYTEHPLTQIVSIGQEPVSNTMVGLNEDFKAQAPWLTDAIDKLPFIKTKAPSEITSSTEVAAMIPGHPKYIGSTGNAYIDNFEGSESFIDISQPYNWSVASIPQGQPSLFPELYNGVDTASTSAGYNRAKLAWYVVDPLFQQQTAGVTPAGESASDMSDNFSRMVLQTEVFPNEQSPTGTPLNLPVLNVGFYPTQKGPYNYDYTGATDSRGRTVSAGLDFNTGQLNAPQTRWGGIQRPIQETDFEANNIGFIEFWMMDPYNTDNNPTTTDSNLLGPNNTGTLYFDLGDVSEDVLPDGLKSFENGLPTNASDAATPNNTTDPWTATRWGHVPTNPSLVNAFDNNTASRPFQDIGLDGLSDAQEQVFFSSYLTNAAKHLSTNAYSAVSADPSSDDFHYYRGDDYDARNLGVLDRYMKYNGLEGNSETSAQYANQNPAGGNYPTTQSTLPNTEDINQDNTLSTDETYYEYAVKFDKKDINPNNVGNNFITDAFQGPAVTTPNGNKSVYWYQFKIPITEFQTKVGPIADFKSIRFIRMYFKGFDKPVMCRFAKLELVRDDWRKFNGVLLAPGNYIPSNNNFTTFNMYGVNLEENASSTPVSYVIPPGIQRQLNLQSANLVQENEGSLALQICDLQDGDARGVYKNVQLDLRAYKNLQMFVHCHSLDAAHQLKNGDVTAFIRLGSDFTNNYYEYEVPMSVTVPGSYSSNNTTDQSTVWPDANQMNIVLNTLENAKLARDAAMGTNASPVALEVPFTVKDGANNITVVGNPTISNVQVIMLGVRNPKKSTSTPSDDGQPKCAEVWFDELRMTNFSEKGGVAAITRETAKLADWGTLSLAGNVSTPGFGSLETTVGNLSRETDLGYTVATNLEMGKLLPPSLNLSIPTYFSIGQQFVQPEYNPLDPDILMSQAESVLSKTQIDSLKREVQSVTTQKSLNFTNVHVNKSKNAKKSHFYDIQNFSATYAYTQQDHRDVNTIHSITEDTKGSLLYTYSFHPKAIQPLVKSEFFKKNKYLALIRDFNFYPMPDKLSVTANIDRGYNDFLMRVIIPGASIELPDQVSKTFNILRNYNFVFPLTKSLKFDYTATNDSRVMEPEGRPILTPADRDSVRNAFLNHSQNTDFKQSENLNYDIPINKLPYLDFVTATARYTANYEWMAAPFAEPSLGATIQNSNTKQLNGQLNMTMLYNKLPFFKKFLQDDSKNKQGQSPNRAGGKGNLFSNKNNPKKGLSQHAIDSLNKASDTTKSPVYYAEKYFVHILTSVKNISFTYSKNQGMVLPGYSYGTRFFGMDDANSWVPGPKFVFGGGQKPITIHLPQNPSRGIVVPEFINEVIANNWLDTTRSIYTPFTTVLTESFSIHTTLEPIPDLKIDLTATHTTSKTTSEYIHDSLVPGQPKPYTVIDGYTEGGSFSMSYFMLGTLFEGNTAGDLNLFYQYLDNRIIISRRLGLNSGTTVIPHTGYYDGYSAVSQNVVIPAFLAAYSGRSAGNIPLTAFPSIPFPNWTISYSGLSKLIPWVKNNTQSVTISSAYTSSYSVGSFNYNLLYNPDGEWVRDINNDFIPQDQIPTVALTEQFSPLIKIGVTLKSNIMSNIEVRTDRQVALNMSDLSVNEVHGQEYIAGLGYKIKNLQLPIKIGNKPLKNDLTIKLDLSLRENQTILRNTENLSSQITGGQSILSIKSQAEYNINQRVSVRLFFDKVINTPFISSSYPTSTMDGGIAIRFTLS